MSWSKRIQEKQSFGKAALRRCVCHFFEKCPSVKQFTHTRRNYFVYIFMKHTRTPPSQPPTPIDMSTWNLFTRTQIEIFLKCVKLLCPQTQKYLPSENSGHQKRERRTANKKNTRNGSIKLLCAIPALMRELCFARPK